MITFNTEHWTDKVLDEFRIHFISHLSTSTPCTRPCIACKFRTMCDDLVNAGFQVYDKKGKPLEFHIDKYNMAEVKQLRDSLRNLHLKLSCPREINCDNCQIRDFCKDVIHNFDQTRVRILEMQRSEQNGQSE